jgi:hypothetical protein
VSYIDEVIDLREAAEIAGRTEEAMRKACQRGTLPAKRVGGAVHRSTWVTTRQELAEYIAWSRARTHFLPRYPDGKIAKSRRRV